MHLKQVFSGTPDLRNLLGLSETMPHYIVNVMLESANGFSPKKYSFQMLILTISKVPLNRKSNVSKSQNISSQLKMKGVLLLLIPSCPSVLSKKAHDTHFAPQDTDLRFPQVTILNPVHINIALSDTGLTSLRLSWHSGPFRKPASCPGSPVLRDSWLCQHLRQRLAERDSGFHCPRACPYKSH